MPIAFQVPLNWSHVKTDLEHLFFCGSQQTYLNMSCHTERTGLDSRYFIFRPLACHLSVVGLK